MDALPVETREEIARLTRLGLTQIEIMRELHVCRLETVRRWQRAAGLKAQGNRGRRKLRKADAR